MRRRSRGAGGAPAWCRACGMCCEEFGDTLAAEEADLARWRAEGRRDLLARVGEGGALWIDPETGRALDHCPFLARTGAGASLCSIHETKPAMCGAYPDDAHGFHCAAGIWFGGSGRRQA
ncbi:MAG: YkgJ family cysteine cluster protein [Thermodesulfobacteriota bacterium]